jgi:hypothetical protein
LVPAATDRAEYLHRALSVLVVAAARAGVPVFLEVLLQTVQQPAVVPVDYMAVAVGVVTRQVVVVEQVVVEVEHWLTLTTIQSRQAVLYQYKWVLAQYRLTQEVAEQMVPCV